MCSAGPSAAVNDGTSVTQALTVPTPSQIASSASPVATNATIAHGVGVACRDSRSGRGVDSEAGPARIFATSVRVVYVGYAQAIPARQSISEFPAVEC